MAEAVELMEIEMPDGTIVTDVPSGTTDEEILEDLRRQFTESEVESMLIPFTPAQLPPTSAQPFASQNFTDVAQGRLEALGTILSSAIAEPAAGVAGLAATLTPFLRSGAGAAVTEGVREGLTFQPRTRSGKQSLQTVRGVSRS